MRTLRLTSLAILAAVLATGCGGGSDSSDTPIAEPLLAQISITNQDTVAHAAVASIVPFTGLSTVGVAPSPGVAAAAPTGSSPSLGAILLNQSLRLARPDPPPAPTGLARPLAVHSSAEACIISGTVSLTWDDRDNSQAPSAGDVFTFSFVQCSDWADSSINGVMVLSLSSISLAAGATSMSGGLSLQQLVLIDGAATLSMNGGISFSINETLDTGGTRAAWNYVVSNAGLTVSTSGVAAGFADTLNYRAGYTVSEQDFIPDTPGAAGTSAVTISGNFKSSTLGGDLSLVTNLPFRLTDPDAYPHEGQLMVNGLNGTRLGITVLSGTRVEMNVCDDGDGTWESTKTVDWSWLMQP